MPEAPKFYWLMSTILGSLRKQTRSLLLMTEPRRNKSDSVRMPNTFAPRP